MIIEEYILEQAFLFCCHCPCVHNGVLVWTGMTARAVDGSDAGVSAFVTAHRDTLCTICQKAVIRRVAHNPDAKLSVDPVTVFFGCAHIVHMRCVRDRTFVAVDQLSCPRCVADAMGMSAVSVDGASPIPVEGSATMWAKWVASMGSSQQALRSNADSIVPGRLPVDVGGDETADIMRASVNAHLHLIGPTGEGRPTTRAQSLVNVERLYQTDDAMREIMSCLDKPTPAVAAASALVRGDELAKVLAPANTTKNAKSIADHGLLWTFLFGRGDFTAVLNAAPTWAALLEVGLDRITRTYSTDGRMAMLYQWPGSLSVRALVQHPRIRLTFEMFWRDICKCDYELLRMLRVPEVDLVLMGLDFELHPAIFLVNPEALCAALAHIELAALVTRFNLTRRLFRQAVQEAIERGDSDLAERLRTRFGHFVL